MTAVHAQSGRSFTTKYALHMFGRDRETVDVAWPGDIVGLVNATLLHPGDTLYAADAVQFQAPPPFTPELFALVSPEDTGTVKKFRKGLAQLAEEGVVQLLESERRGPQTPVLGAVGPMQFEVLDSRMRTDFGVSIRISALPYTVACPIDTATADILQGRRDCEVVNRRDQSFALFSDIWRLRALQRERPELTLDVPRQSMSASARPERRAS